MNKIKVLIYSISALFLTSPSFSSELNSELFDYMSKVHTNLVEKGKISINDFVETLDEWQLEKIKNSTIDHKMISDIKSYLNSLSDTSNKTELHNINDTNDINAIFDEYIELYLKDNSNSSEKRKELVEKLAAINPIWEGLEDKMKSIEKEFEDNELTKDYLADLNYTDLESALRNPETSIFEIIE